MQFLVVYEVNDNHVGDAIAPPPSGATSWAVLVDSDNALGAELRAESVMLPYIRDSTFHCDICGYALTISTEPLYEDSDTLADYVNDRRYHVIDSDGNKVSLPNAYNGLTVGCEVECYLPVGERPNLPRWSYDSDGSLRAPSGYRSHEIKSPIYSENQVSEIIATIRAIKDARATVNDYCGGHVHIGGHYTGNTIEDMQTALYILQNTANVENAIYEWSGGEKRKNGQYASPIAENLQVGGIRQALDLFSSRYHSVNVYSHYETSEFRIFAGTVSPDAWAINIAIALKIVKASLARETLPKITTVQELCDVFELDKKHVKTWAQQLRAMLPTYPNHKFSAIAIELWRKFVTDKPSLEQRQELKNILVTVIDGFMVADNNDENRVTYMLLATNNRSYRIMRTRIGFSNGRYEWSISQLD